MSAARLVLRSVRASPRIVRPFSSATARFGDAPRPNDTVDAYRKAQTEKPLNPHLTNTTSTIANEMPSIGKDNVPPEMITSVDPSFTAKDSVPENTERMTGGTQSGTPESGVNADLEVGEMEGGSFRVEPLRRTGEDTNTTRARLLYQSRKRGTLESDLLMSTFADRYLETMSPKQLQQYDLFLDENDWDIYYWATQEPTPTSLEYAEGGGPDQATPVAQGKPAKDQPVRPAGTGEWAQTVGLFKPAYRPVPQRWKNSEVLAMLRQHVKDRSAGGVLEGDKSGEATPDNKSGQGMGFMPELKNFDK
ncbi:DUF339-domain-containing protein [Aureobasidium pullulans]|nr:DUF339-domain-containing protein [Aureobasidium pullulans]